MQKLYYSISEISKLVDEEQHILRYWEKEFEQLKPRKNRAGNRVYSERDLKIIKYIKKLIRDEKLSLKGAKDQLKKYLELEAREEKHPSLFGTMLLDIKPSIPEKKESKKDVQIPAKEFNELLGLLKETIKYLSK